MSSIVRTKSGYKASFNKGSGINRIRITRGFRTKSEATAFIAHQTLKFNSGGQRFRINLLISDYFDLWFNLEKTNISVATKQTYRASKCHIKKVLPTTKIININYAIMQSAINTLGMYYSHETIRKDVSHLRSMFSCAIRMGDISQDPMRDIVIPRNQMVKKTVDQKVMPRKDYLKLRNFLLHSDTTPNKLNDTIILLILVTGLRVSEALGLPLKNIDFNANTIRIEQAWKRYTKTVGSTKTVNAKRKIPIPETVSVQLKKLARFKQENDLIFSNETGHVPQPSTINSAYKRLQQQLKITGKYSIHTIRHTIASLLLNQGANIVQVSRLLGHSSPRITAAYYLGLVPDNKLEERKKMMELLN